MSDSKEVILSEPMFQPAENDCGKSTKCEKAYNRSLNCFEPKSGGHYNHYSVIKKMAITLLRRIFPEGKANELNFVLFSTSGVHGTYNTIEDAEKVLMTAPVDLDEDDLCLSEVTFVIIQPRLCTIHYGNCEPKNNEDIKFLKSLRQSSWDAVLTIGAIGE